MTQHNGGDCYDLDDVKALLAAGGLGDAAAARGAVDCCCAKIALAADGSAEQLAALEVLEQCLVADEGAMVLAASSQGCELLLTLSVHAERQSPHQLSALASIANLSAACRDVRATVRERRTRPSVRPPARPPACTHACTHAQTQGQGKGASCK